MPLPSPAPVSRHPLALALGVVLTLAANPPALGLMTSQEGNDPLSPANYTDWPGLAEVFNDPSRVFHVWVNGNEQAFYRGDVDALERTLRAFAATKIEERIVFLSPGRGKLSQKVADSAEYGWELHLVAGISRGLLDEPDAELIWTRHPTLTVYTGGVELGQLQVPAGVTEVVGAGELRERYLRGLRSRSLHVRHSSLARLAEIDPYGEESAAAIAALGEDEDVQSSVERALAYLAGHANDPSDVRARHTAQMRSIRRFVFAWRYPWLEHGLTAALAVAGVLLAVTLLVGRARRTRSRRQPASDTTP